jgi:hypothetical protein
MSYAHCPTGKDFLQGSALHPVVLLDAPVIIFAALGFIK